MRKILFRGKRKDNGEWVYGFYVCLNGKEHRIYTGYAETDCDDFYPDIYSVMPETVGQFSWLTDTDRNRVYDGDIVRVWSSNIVGECLSAIAVVKFDDYELMRFLDCSNEIMVIGNIHDNPELLKGENEE